MKILVIVIFILGLATTAHPEKKAIDFGVKAVTFCLDGYKFITVITPNGEGISVGQIYKRGADGKKPPQPIRCDRWLIK